MDDELFEEVRDVAPSGAWSIGVQLARSGNVVLEREGDDEITLRVISGAGRRAYEVTLWPEDLEWQCECGQSEDACGHVAASVIALRQSRRDGKAMPAPEQRLARLAYRLRREGGALTLQRVIVDDGRERPFDAGITTDGSGPHVIKREADLRVERVLGTWRRGLVPSGAMPSLLAALVGCEDVTLDGRPVEVSADPVTPVAVVRDSGDGFHLQLVADPDIEVMFKNRAVLRDGALRPVGDGDLTEREILELRQGRYVRPEDAAELVTRTIPGLKKRVPVRVEATRLPTGEPQRPRLLLEVSDDEDELTVLPTIVYGDPAVARVDRGRLVLLGGALPIRSERAEDHLRARLAQRLGLEPGRKARFSGEQAVAFAARLDRFDEGEVVGDAHERYFLAPPLVGEVGFDADGGLSLAFRSDEQVADPARVIRCWQRGLQLAPLEDGGWAALPRDWLRRYGDALAALLLARDERGELPPSAVGDVLRLADALGTPAPPRFERLRAIVDDFEGVQPATLPEDLTATLRSYQRRGVDWLRFMGDAGLGALLADDMGLGKTLQALSALKGRSLVVAPTSVIHNWRQEAARFRPALRVCVYHGPKRALDPEADLVITSYALLRLDLETLRGRRWDTVVLDEAQAIKNPDSQVTQAAFQLEADFRLTLTGTPVENRLDDLWSQLHFLNPGLLGGRDDFRERYADPIAEGRSGAAASLRERVRPFILRRLKREVAPELPPRTEVVLRCELSVEERDVYEAMRAATRREVIERLTGGGNVIAALEALLRLRQAACHRGLLPGQEAAGSSKVDLLLELLTEAVAEQHKALVFSQWTSLLDLVEPHLRAAGLDFVRLDGSTRDRGAVVDAFQDEAGPPVMLLSLKAGGTGLNLTAADHVVLLDPWWNPAVEDQAADRAHRIGQDRPVLVHRLVAADTVEERILALQESKRALAEAAIGEADQAGGLSREDLLGLLEG